jgi:Ca2+-binding EF-hand superfamily protein
MYRKPAQLEPFLKPHFGVRVKLWDTDQDGSLSMQEYKEGIGTKEDAAQRFKYFDSDHDGVLTEKEFVQAGKPE